uniref:Uncharacterized protein n=1 Tax=Strigamia maritima TaxID=126957 RepID=T1IWV3_STRMM
MNFSLKNQKYYWKSLKSVVTEGLLTTPIIKSVRIMITVAIPLKQRLKPGEIWR